MRTALHIRWIGLVVAAMACGGGSDNPPTNTTPVAASVDLTVSGSSPITAIGDTRTISATVRDANGAAIASAPVSFSSSNASVATISGSGSSATLTSTGNGTTTITATSGAATETVQVVVEQRLANVLLTVAPMVMGTTAQLQPQARDSRNAPITGATGFTITSGSPNVLAVDATGLATAISPGTSQLTVSLTRDGATATGNATVNVSSPIPQTSTVTVTATTSSQFDPQNAFVDRGGTVNFVFQSLSHTVDFASSSAPADIETSANTSVARTFPTAGSFPYVCTIHSGMSGTITVADAGFLVALSGANERPTPSSSTATGAAAISRSGSSIEYVVTFQGLTGPPIGAHLHGPAGVDGVADILVNLNTASQSASTGVLTGTFTASAIQGVNGQPPMSLDELMELMQAGDVYVNVHTTQFPAGEIRGQIAPP